MNRGKPAATRGICPSAMDCAPVVGYAPLPLWLCPPARIVFASYSLSVARYQTRGTV